MIGVLRVLVMLLLSAGSASAQGMRGGLGADEHFLPGRACALCHSASPQAQALWNKTGDDVSPHGTWQGTMMANAFRDPYWRAQVAKEVAAAPEKRAEIEGLCLTCHGPMVHHDALLGGRATPSIAAAAEQPLARDGVSCTVCHQAQPDGLGTEASFSGRLTIRGERKIFGPYEDPAFQPMRMHTGYVATHGAHVQKAGLCGSCHTLITSHVPGAKPFPEQTPYLEWRNSSFSDEGSDEGGATKTSRTCQECHMPAQGDMRIARNPMGRDFNIATRPDVRAHAFVGGNAFMLDLLRKNREELKVEAPEEALLRTARATRRQLAHDAATLEIEGAFRDGAAVSFAVRVTNLTGHKLPTGYPARRAWLRVSVRVGNDTVFASGDLDAQGRIAGVEDERALPHRDRITDAAQVQVYECVPVNADGTPTTHLTRMAAMGKDNRLLPAGWRSDAPDAARIAPVGIGDDTDFRGGEDLVHYAVTLPDGASGRVVIVATLLYQSVPPSWVEPLRTVDADEARTFVRMYDAMEKGAETLALAVKIVAE